MANIIGTVVFNTSYHIVSGEIFANSLLSTNSDHAAEKQSHKIRLSDELEVAERYATDRYSAQYNALLTMALELNP